ncbi:MAG: hypothetical protein ACK4KW_05295 [Gemmobacter sp.]
MIPEDQARDARRMRAILVMAATVAFVLSAFVTPGFDGFDPNRFPIPQVDPPVQPAGFAFSIWGLIYLWLLVSAATGLSFRADRPDWDPPRWPLIGSLVVGTPWLAAANTSPPLATVMIWIMLALAVVALMRTPAEDRWLYQAPVGLYAGWLTAASAVATGILAGGYGWLSPEVAAVVGIVIAGVVALTVLQILPRPCPEYAIAAGWGLFGIAFANFRTDPGLAVVAVAALVLVLLRAFRPLMTRR